MNESSRATPRAQRKACLTERGIEETTMLFYAVHQEADYYRRRDDKGT